MTNFSELYSEVYDILNEGKDYKAEVEFLLSIYESLTGSQELPQSVLDLGCGSGMHLSHFPSSLRKIGVDRSGPMLALARHQHIDKASFLESTIADCRIETPCDFVYSLFHVLSYQTTEIELIQMFQTISTNISDCGIAVIDFWHRATWDIDPPTTRVTSREKNEISIKRVSRPKLDRVSGIVELEIDVFVSKGNATNGSFMHFTENHLMRAFTLLELSVLARHVGLEIVASGPWMEQSRTLSTNDWYGWVALRPSTS